jgi:hypothetical protein
MEEKERTCILCGGRQEMLGYICPGCQERIQKEAIAKQREVRGETEMEVAGHKVTNKV